MSAHDQLEQQLRASVARAAGQRSMLRLGRRSSSRGVSALIVASSVVALGLAVFALGTLHAHRPPSRPVAPALANRRSRLGPAPRDPGPIPRNVDDSVIAAAWNTAYRQDPACRGSSAAGAGAVLSYGRPSAAMLATLPVLSRPTTPADRLPASVQRRLLVRGGQIYVRYVRRIRTIGGSTYYLVPEAGLGQPPLSRAAANRCYDLTVAALRAGLPKVPRSERAATQRYGDAEFAVGRYHLETSRVQQGVFLFRKSANGGGGGVDETLAMIRQGGQLGGGGGGRPSTSIVMDGIVPAGVATVTLTFPAAHYHAKRLPALNATGDVVNNVFVILIPTLFQRGAWPATAIWRSASGQLIKTINERPFHP